MSSARRCSLRFLKQPGLSERHVRHSELVGVSLTRRLCRLSTMAAGFEGTVDPLTFSKSGQVKRDMSPVLASHGLFDSESWQDPRCDVLAVLK